MDRRLTSNNKNTPLRNSKFVNKPFRSPINAAAGLTPKNNRNVKLLSRSVDSLKTTLEETTKENATPKRSHSIDESSLLKRRRIQLEKITQEDSSSQSKTATTTTTTTTTTTRADVSALKRKIRNKKQEIESIKIKLSYRNKHQTKDLNAEIIKWRNVCHEALIQLQKEWNENNSEGVVLSDINKVIRQLNIPPDVVKFPDD